MLPPPLHSLGDSGLSVDGVPCVLRALSTCGTLETLDIRWELPAPP